MLNEIRQHISTISFATIALMAASIPAIAQTRHTLTVDNNSGIAIYHVQMSSTRDRSWERDLLGSGILYDGNSFTVTDITPGYYDIKVVDQDGDACVVNSVSVFNDMEWNLTPFRLVGCELH
jgi:hypothetical protein